jgi:hypothetical protein
MALMNKVVTEATFRQCKVRIYNGMLVRKGMYLYRVKNEHRKRGKFTK